MPEPHSFGRPAACRSARQPERSHTTGAAMLTAAVLATALSPVLHAADVGNPARPSAGLYEVTTKTDFGELPIPATTLTTTNCVTEEDLEQDPQSIFADNPASDNCTMRNFNMSGGDMSMHLTCNSDDGSMVMDTSGSYTAASYSLNTVIDIQAGGKTMQTKATVEGKLIGACP